MASPMPVLPLVASTTVWPGFSSPDFSPASMTPSARRSLTEPSGLNASTLTQRFTPGGPRRLMRTTGVLPMVPRMLSWRAMQSPPNDFVILFRYAWTSAVSRDTAAYPVEALPDCRETRFDHRFEFIIGENIWPVVFDSFADKFADIERIDTRRPVRGSS